MEIKKISHKLAGACRRGCVQLKKYRFAKVRIFRNKRGEVFNESSFVEHAYLVACRGKGIWLSPDDLYDLRELLEASSAVLPGFGSSASQKSQSELKEFLERATAPYKGKERSETRFPSQVRESGPIVIEAASQGGDAK